MLAVFKRELASYFHTMTGYIFMVFLFVVVGIYFSAYNLSYQYSLFGYALVSAAFAMLITTPMLSMKVLAEERRQKVDQLLLTSPVPLYQIVLGKYLAMITVFAVPMLVFCLYPVILSRYGEVACRDVRGDLGILSAGLCLPGHRPVHFFPDGKSGDGGGVKLWRVVSVLYDERSENPHSQHCFGFLPHSYLRAAGSGLDPVPDDPALSAAPAFLRGGRGCHGRRLSDPCGTV